MSNYIIAYSFVEDENIYTIIVPGVNRIMAVNVFIDMIDMKNGKPEIISIVREDELI